ncbi:hypothetical protein MYAM1_002031 [Malassezia yamatoensis]|uniref:INO80 complex subunit B-like conserved region domain-containing protein n=1 Tax=Malassezia yamatoensis TaxID=253288 RepID=A0AAJ5YT42_9BASI|nr:hypothetical protein MYAM1_002031 [Malassezia yamatoensis]
MIEEENSPERDQAEFDDGEMEDEESQSEGMPSSEVNMSEEEEEEEEDELVDEMEEAEPIETNRRTRRPLRIKLSRSKVQSDSTPNSTPSRRSGRRTTRTARAIGSAGGSSGSEDSEDEDEDQLASESMDQPMTARQIARANRKRGIQNEDLLELPIGMWISLTSAESKRQKLSESELALRRSETARRRRNQSEKKLEDDKIETINRLLKKQAGKIRAGKDKGEDRTDSHDAQIPRRSEPLPMFRYISRAEGAMLAVPLGPPFVDDKEAEGLYDHTLRTAFGQSTEKWKAATAN